MVMVTETFTGPRGKRVSDKSAALFNDPNIFLRTCHVYFVKIYNFPLILWQEGRFPQLQVIWTGLSPLGYFKSDDDENLFKLVKTFDEVIVSLMCRHN